MTIPAAYSHAVANGFTPESRTAFHAEDEAQARAYALHMVPDIMQHGWNHLKAIARAGEVCVCCLTENQGSSKHSLKTRPVQLPATDPRLTEALTISRFDALRELFAAEIGWWAYWLTESTVHFSRFKSVDVQHVIVRHDVHLRWHGGAEPAPQSVEQATAAVRRHLLATAPEGLAYLRKVYTAWAATREQGFVDFNAPTHLHPQIEAWLGSPTGKALLAELTGEDSWQLFCCCGPTLGSPMGLVSWVNQLIAQNPARIMC